LRSLVGAESAAPPVEALRCFAELDISVEVNEIEPGVVMPTAETDAKVFGSADVASWIKAYQELCGFPDATMTIAGKPTVEELQAMLDDPMPVHIQTMPDGSIRAFKEYPGEFTKPKILSFEEGMDLLGREETGN
jgi:hypothetical protein